MKKYLLPRTGKFYKANLHCHSTVSDGKLTPAELKEAYKVDSLRYWPRQAGNDNGTITKYEIQVSNDGENFETVASGEWGFDGVVMTDWYSTNPGQGDNALCMSAGNDLIMPGTPLNKHQILMGIRNGKISKKDLRRCCGNVIRQILDSDIQRQYRA